MTLVLTIKVVFMLLVEITEARLLTVSLLLPHEIIKTNVKMAKQEFFKRLILF